MLLRYEHKSHWMGYLRFVLISTKIIIIHTASLLMQHRIPKQEQHKQLFTKLYLFWRWLLMTVLKAFCTQCCRTWKREVFHYFCCIDQYSNKDIQFSVSEEQQRHKNAIAVKNLMTPTWHHGSLQQEWGPAAVRPTVQIMQKRTLILLHLILHHNHLSCCRFVP